MKQFLTLKGEYDALKVRRLAKFGRIELLRVIPDQNDAPYWFVRINGFNEKRDRPRLIRAGSKFGNGYFRFGYLDEAREKFAHLKEQPESVAEEKERLKLRDKKKQQVLEQIKSGKMMAFSKKPPNWGV
jgi:hypothetical protein